MILEEVREEYIKTEERTCNKDQFTFILMYDQTTEEVMMFTTICSDPPKPNRTHRKPKLGAK